MSAQHRGMLDQVLEVFDLSADVDLDLMVPGQSPAGIASGILDRLPPLLRQVRPDVVLVQGDTTTTFAAAFAAFLERIPTGHIEAGLRTGDRWQPFPEEMNRVLTTRIAALHFAPTPAAREALLAEGMPAGDVYLTGNTVIDALLQTVRADYRFRTPALAALDPTRRVVLVTTHRRESFGAPLRSTCGALRELAERFPELQFVLPVHPNPEVKRTVEELLCDLPGMHLIPPVDYLEFVHLMARADLVLTDSGGVQEEAPSLGQAGAGAPGGHRAARRRHRRHGAGGGHRPGPHRGRRDRAADVARGVWADGERGQSVRRRPGQRAHPHGPGGTLRMRLLVTGGTGFIGSHLAEEGRRRGAEVVVLGLNDRPGGARERGAARPARRGDHAGEHHRHRAVPARGAWRHPRLPPRRRHAGGRQERRLLRAGESRRHPAAARGRGGGAGPAVRLLRYDRDLRPPGTGGHQRISPLRPGNTYERTKVAAERMVREQAPAAGVPFTILRPADVYGPRDQRLLKLFRGVGRGRFPLFGDGRGRRHMVYVDDVVAAFFAACERPEAVGEAMIVAGPRPCTLAELIEEVRQATGSARYGRRAAAGPDAGRGGGGRGCVPKIAPRPADLSAADGLLHERLGLRYGSCPPGARLGPAGGAGRRGPADGEDYRRTGALT